MKKKPIDKYIELFGDLTIDKLKHFDHIVDPNIEFTDPFNIVKGLDCFLKGQASCNKGPSVLP